MRTAHRTFVRVDTHRPEVMHWALGRRRAASGPVLWVYALGAFRIERRGIPIYQLGGPKAGNRQAAGLFAFLFDRAERGATKDEIIDVIWPDVPIECADTAFHRTLGGLRRTLITGQVAEPIRLQNDRYRLDHRLWTSSDVASFQLLIEQARGCAADTDRIALLERAKRLYLADYLDDCPYYGDSVHVEARRVALRDQLLDLFEQLALSYERIADPWSARDKRRQASISRGDEVLPRLPEQVRLGAR